MAKRRSEKRARVIQCKNPDCGKRFRTKKYGRKEKNQVYCSRACQQHGWFLDKLAKKRTESVLKCPLCNGEFTAQIVPKPTGAQAA